MTKLVIHKIRKGEKLSQTEIESIYSIFGEDFNLQKVEKQINKVWFYDMESDGYSLDDKKNKLDHDGDIPDIIEKWRQVKKDKELEPTKEDKWL